MTFDSRNIKVKPGESQVCAACGMCPDHCPCPFGGVHVPGNYGSCIACDPRNWHVPSPINGWTVKHLITVLRQLPPDAQVKVLGLRPFDIAALETRSPRVSFEDGEVRLS